jgi:hypothetical protein
MKIFYQVSTSIPITIVLALCSGLIGALLSPFFQAHLIKESSLRLIHAIII